MKKETKRELGIGFLEKKKTKKRFPKLRTYKSLCEDKICYEFKN